MVFCFVEIQEFVSKFVPFFFHSMQSIQNLGLAVISQVSGAIVDKDGYLILEVFFCVWMSGGSLQWLLLFSVVVI